MRSTTCDVIGRFGGVATTAQLLTVMTRQQLDVQVRKGGLVKVWKGVYAARTPDLAGRLDALDLFVGRPVVACMGTAAALYGFDFENTTSVHVLDPGIRLRSKVGLTVHQRTGAPLRRVADRLATSPAWTAVEVARQLPKPRGLAVLDGALASGSCTHEDLERAVWEQVGRRGIVRVRDLLPFADGRAESAMESEARLVFIDYRLPVPELQFEIRGPRGELWRVDFAWPEHGVVAEYESVAWHTGRAEMLRDKRRSAGIQQLDWTYVPIVVDDVRIEPWRLADRISHHLSRRARAS